MHPPPQQTNAQSNSHLLRLHQIIIASVWSFSSIVVPLGSSDRSSLRSLLCRTLYSYLSHFHVHSFTHLNTAPVRETKYMTDATSLMMSSSWLYSDHFRRRKDHAHTHLFIIISLNASFFFCGLIVLVYMH